MMMHKISTLLKRPGIRYLIVGVTVYALELLIIVIAQHFGASPVWAVAIAYVLGTSISFIMQKLVTFGDKRMHHKVLIPQIVATTVLITWNFGFSILVTKIFENSLPPVVSRTLALGITTLWNFYLYRTRIFKSDDNPVY